MMIVCVFVIELLMVYTLFECITQFYFFAVDVGWLGRDTAIYEGSYILTCWFSRPVLPMGSEITIEILKELYKC